MLWLGFAEMRGPNPPRPNPSGPPRPMPKGAQAKGPGGPGGPGPKGAPGKGPGPKQGAGDDDLLDDEEEEDGEVGAVVADIMPWAMSILLHAGIVILAIIIIWTKLPQIEEEEPIIPIARLSEKPGAPLNMKTTTTPQKSSSSKRNVTKSKKVNNKIATKVKADMSLIGVAGGAESKASPFGTSVGTGGPFSAGFFGSGGNAKRLAYVVDASGSLIDTLHFVVAELKRSINGLSEQQSFTVIFFQGETMVEAAGSRGLRPVTSENKVRTFDWMDPEAGNIKAEGKAGDGALKAMRTALGYKPQLMFLLSDNITGHGQFEVSQAEFCAAVKQANKNKVKINTIQFLYPDPLTKIGMRSTLERISKESGGMYKFVGGRELGIAR